MSVTQIPTEYLKNLPEEMQGFEPVAVICNILPDPVLPINQTYGVYHVASPKPGERYALTPIRWAALYMDKGDSNFNVRTRRGKAGDPREDNRIRMIQGAREIAEDLCQQMNTSDSKGGTLEDTGPFWGKFVLKGTDPTEEELAKAEGRMTAYFLSVVRAADVEWAKSQRLDLIDSRSRTAARHLRINDRPWQSEYIPNMPCPACRESIRQGARVCRHCGAMIDESGELAAQERPPAAAARKASRRKAKPPQPEAIAS